MAGMWLAEQLEKWTRIWWVRCFPFGLYQSRLRAGAAGPGYPLIHDEIGERRR